MTTSISILALAFLALFLYLKLLKERRAKVIPVSVDPNLLKKIEELNNLTITLQSQLLNEQEVIKSERLKIAECSQANQDILNQIPDLIKKEREKAIESSRVVLKGKISEHLAPFMPNFPYKSGDLRFLGSPIDFICFEGISDGKIQNIILIDVKTGEAKLSERQKQIKDSVENCHLKFEVFRIH